MISWVEKPTKVLEPDVCIIGAGAAGLMVAAMAQKTGLETHVLEQSAKLADGPSTRNNGWLHSGSYHAASVANRGEAIEVARRCSYGSAWIQQNVPESVREPLAPSFALLSDSRRIDEVEARWRDAGVPFRRSTESELSALAPEVEARASAIYVVADRTLNTRVLYSSLYQEVVARGGTILTDSTVGVESLEEATVEVDGIRIRVRPRLAFVYTMGFRTPAFLRQQLNVELPVRYWKSHLLITPNLGSSMVFFLDAGEAAAVHHGKATLFGRHEDARRIDVPDYEVVNDDAQLLEAAARRLVKFGSIPTEVVACIKPDIEGPAAARSLGASWGEPVPNHFWMLPGKMTEAPFAAQALLHSIFDRFDAYPIAKRPLDYFAERSSAGTREGEPAMVSVRGI